MTRTTKTVATTTHHDAGAGTIRWGLCCQFLDAPIRFRQATHRYVATLGADARRTYLADIARANAIALAHAVERCHEIGIGAFRINSQIAPLATHPESGYTLESMDGGDVIVRAYRAAGDLARMRDVRLSFHPDQFVVLNSEREAVVASSVQELEHQAAMAELVGADVLCLHGGGATGGHEAALERLERGVARLSPRARNLLALENDDRSFGPAELLPFCERTGIPFIYDAHHHRCRPDGTSVAEATERAVATWRGREAYFHLSSPRDGWTARNPRPHSDYVDPADFPAEWRGVRATVDVEAKEKERAVLAIRDATLAMGVRASHVAHPVHADGDDVARTDGEVALFAARIVDGAADAEEDAPVRRVAEPAAPHGRESVDPARARQASSTTT